MTDNENTAAAAVMAPPRSEVGVIGWMRVNLFSTWYNVLMTVTSVLVVVWFLWYGLTWALGDAEWRVIGTLGGQFIIGQYNTVSACPGQNCFWRPQVGLLLATLVLGMAWGVAGGGTAKKVALVVAFVSAAMALIPYSFERMGMDVRILLVANIPAVYLGLAITHYTPWREVKHVAIVGVVSFLLTLFLLRGFEGLPGMQPVSVIHWGGLMLNILLAVAGIVLSLPIGIGLALGRRSQLPVVKLLCVVFIEIFRGVPLITLLFMSQVLVPLAFPENFPQNSLFRAAVVITLFSSAYMAENIRGGLQALHPGQAEAARALGLSGWQITFLISLPQAIRNVIPAIVGQFIALFKDTSLVYIIGMLDVIEIGRAFIQGNPEYLPSARELFIFLAIVFWIFTYGMSYVSRRVEDHMRVGAR